MLVLIFGFLYLIYVCFNCLKRQRNILKEFPEPPATFFFGHALDVKSSTDILKVSSKYFNNYGKTVKIRMGPMITGLYSADHKFVEFLLSSNTILTKSLNYAFLQPWLRSGLLINDGVHWKQHRRILTPAFHLEILKQFVGTFESVGSILIDKLNTCHESPSIDLYPLVTLCTLDIICETAMDTKINAQDDENSEYVRSVKEMCRIITDRASSVSKLLDWTFALTADYRIQKKALKILHGFTSGIINTKKAEIKDQNDVNITTGRKKMAFLDLLLNVSDEGQLSSHEIRDEMDTFMFAGHDTTASGISFTLFCLANHPEIQDRVLREQQELFGGEKNPIITYQDLQNMKYLELVIKETLRLYPSVPIIGRLTNEDIKYDGSVIPKRTNIGISIYHLHRNAEYFSEPEKFNPDRFENFDSSLSYVFIPFSAGPRNCIGQKFAMLEMKSVISKISRHFELMPTSPQHDVVLAAETVLKSVSGIKVGLKKRV